MVQKILFLGLLIWPFTFCLKAAEGDLYKFLWLDTDKKVFVLQNKLYKKKNTHYLDVALVQDLSSNFQEVRGAQISYGYYFSEYWAIEGFYHHYTSSDNEDAKKVKDVSKLNPFVRTITSKIGAMLLWAPFYGKINTFNKILYFDLFFGIGLATIGGKDNAETVALQRKKGEDKLSKVSNIALSAKMAMRIYASKAFHFGLEYHLDTYNARNPYDTNGRKTDSAMVNRSEISFVFGITI